MSKKKKTNGRRNGDIETMADITDPVAIAFSNDYLRPQCENSRAFESVVSTMITQWFSGVNLLFPNDDSPVIDGREAEGVRQLTGADVNSAMGVLIAMVDTVNATRATYNKEIIEKPTVRTFQAQ